MPELPEVETVKNMVEKVLQNATVKDIEIRQRKFRNIIPDEFEHIVKGAKVLSLKRKAKYILIYLDNNYTIIWHLGMSGKFKICDTLPDTLDKHDHIIITTDKGNLIYNDVRRFGLVTCCASDKLKENKFLCKLGLDPWDRELTVKYLSEKLKKKKQSIKSALLDQEIICGIGNIYASEILYKARIRPDRNSDSLTENEIENIIKHTQLILEAAIESGGSTIHDFKSPDGDTGHFQNKLCVYGRTGQRCPDCICKNNSVIKIVQNGRSTFFCETLQK